MPSVKVALKESFDPQSIRSFAEEFDLLAKLQHPNLPRYFDTFEADENGYLVMEFVPGQSLEQVLQRQRSPLAEPQVLGYAVQLCDVLGYLHQQTPTIIHRDVKPDNLMITATDTVKLADLGLARCDQDAEEDFTTKTGTMMGTPYYMPPEQGRDAHRADHRADIYATGATLYHMACGKVPFDGETAVAILINASTQPLTWPEPGPSQPVRRLIAALMARRVADRPQSASDALAMLKHLHTGPLAIVGPASADRGPIPSGRLRTSVRSRAARRRRRRWSAYGVLIALGLAMVGAGAWWEYTAGPMRDLRRRVGELTAAHRHAAAIGEVEHARAGRVGDPVALDGLLGQATQAWDVWALKRAQPAFTACDAAIAANRLGDADRALDGIEEAWRSPRACAELEKREQALDQARTRSAASTPDERRQFLQKRLDAWLGQFLGDRAKVQHGIARLTGSGLVTMPPLTVRERTLALPLEVTVRLPADAAPDDRVDLVVGGHAVRFTAAGAALVGGGATRPLAVRDSDGRIVLIIHRRGTVVEVLARDGDAEAVPVGGGGTLTLDWALGGQRTAELSMAAALRAARPR